VIVAKNNLGADEVDTLNRLVISFLVQAGLRVKERHPPHAGLLASERVPAAGL